jgi:phosphatidylglycerol:prolipoprotein diacylglycerol transferase
MRQVLFWIPLKPFDFLPAWWPEQWPLFGYGMMLCIAFFLCPWLAGRRAAKDGIPRTQLQDLALWIFAGGIIGARIVFMIQYKVPLRDFFKVYEGGLVFYGSALGGVVGYAVAYYFIIRKYNLSTWKLMDAVAPAAAVGLCLGRIGCFLNGCCFGNVACADCPKVAFPFSSPARVSLVERGWQTAAGFTMASVGSSATVDHVETDSPAQHSGLLPRDVIIAVDKRPVHSANDLDNALLESWPKGQMDLTLSVERAGKVVKLPPFYPRTLGLHPTQLYESISMVLLFLFLSAFYPFRQHYGEVMVLFMVGYALHRFLDEMLRNDTDPVAFRNFYGGLTFSQVVSIGVLGLAALLWALSRRHPVISAAPFTAGRRPAATASLAKADVS